MNMEGERDREREREKERKRVRKIDREFYLGGSGAAGFWN